MENPNYFAIIPAEVRYNENLSPAAKLFYGEISCLTNKEGYCYASNQYFQNLYKVNESSILRWINQLIKEGYIYRELIYKKGCKEIESRHLKLVTLSAKMQPPTSKNEPTLPSKMQGGTRKNEGDNNLLLIDNNNTVSKTKIKDHLFSESIYNENYDLFLEHAEKIIIDYPNVNIKYYFESIRDYPKRDKYKNSDWMLVLRAWIRNDIKKGDYVKLKVQETKKEVVSKLNPEGKRYFLHSTEHEKIHEILNKQNAREILEAYFGIKSIEDLSQQLDYVLTKHPYSATEIWNRK